MDDKRFFLERFIKENPDSRIIVFVRTRVRAERVAKAMERVGIDSVTIHGEKAQADRTAVMAKFKAGECNLLIATDISARGIDVPNVSHVLNYDLPDQAENYVHRVGRTGRGVNHGVAISFCSKEERPRLEEIQGFLNKEIEVLKIGRKEYTLTVASAAKNSSAMELIREHEAWKKQKQKKRKPKKAKKR